ncbi:MAG: hypothetical protein IKH19_07790 [Muribaculaceae bacterium]|nr:hypothetical protein [Muribaculaceae bacterium]
MKKSIFSMLTLYVALVMVFTLLVVAVHMIPHNVIAAQIEHSLPVFDSEGAYPWVTSVDGRARLDNFTDCYMLNVAFCADNNHPVDAALRNYRYRGNADMIACMHELVEGNLQDSLFEYGKYWHGYQVTLRPLLTVMDYAQIRWLNGVLLALLLAVVLALMWQRLPAGYAVCLMVSLALVHSFVLPWSLQYSNCYYVMLVSMIALLAWPSLSETRLKMAMSFFAVGAITVFFDFFTSPIITLGVPLTVLLLWKREPVTWRTLAVPCVAWAAGFALLWASKWAVAYLLVGYNALAEVTDSVEIHSVGTSTDTMAGMWLSMVKGWFYPSAGNVLKFAILGMLTLLAVWAGRGRQALRDNVWLLALSGIVLAWMLATTHHCYTHVNISSRMYLVSWFATLCFYFKIIDFDKLKRYVRFRS